MRQQKEQAPQHFTLQFALTGHQFPCEKQKEAFPSLGSTLANKMERSKENALLGQRKMKQDIINISLTTDYKATICNTSQKEVSEVELCIPKRSIGQT